MKVIMDHNALVKKIMVLLIAICALGTAACSHVWETVSWRPEMDNSGWVQGEDKLGRFYTFQDESVSVIMREPSHITTVSYGPTPIPIIPAFAGKDIPFDLFAEIESPTNTTTMDFSKLRAQFSGETLLQIKTVQCSIGGRSFKETTKLLVSNGVAGTSRGDVDENRDFISLSHEMEVPMAEIARHVGVCGSAVVKAIRKIESAD